MKILLTRAVVVMALLWAAVAVRPPSALCRASPLPSLIPIQVGEELRFDLQDFFSGYNLFLTGDNQSHISLAQKYTTINSQFSSSYNFQTVKIKPDGRFIGLVTNQAYSNLIIGRSNDSVGVNIQFEVELESADNLHCYDVEELLTHNGSVIVADCANFYMGELVFNEFIFVNLTDKKVIEGSHLHDTFVRYNFISKRRIEVIEDPFSRIPYLVRTHLRDGVSKQHQDETYIEIFMMNDPLNPQLIDVLDRTFFKLQKLSIADIQIHLNHLYVLVYNKGLYEIRLTPDQYALIRSKFDMQLDITRFRVDQLGFNDDLNIVMTNGNTIYQFEWDVTTPPVLIHKYTLAPNSQVQQIFVDYNYVIVTAETVFGEQLVKRTWVFTKHSNSYLNAYNVFHAPIGSPHIIVWNQHGSVLHIFHNYNAFYITMNLPYLDVKPVDASMAGKTQTYKVVATSFGDKFGDNITCSEEFQFIYIQPSDQRIIKTGFWPRNQIFVDSPESQEIPLSFEFFGANLTYNVSFDSASNPPHAYVDKQHKAVFNWPEGILPENIVFYQMFNEVVKDDEKPMAVYGLVQTAKSSQAKILYTTYYVECAINVFDRDETHHLDCKKIVTTSFSMGRIIATSQMFDPKERRIAMIFDSAPNTIYVYYFWPLGFGFFGRKDYAGDAGNRVTGVALAEGKLFAVLEFGKRVDIFMLDDIQESTDVPRNPQPRMTIDSRVMRFFGVSYFAPVNVKVSRFHKETIFLKTKTGVMALNVNQDAIPQLLFTVPTTNIRYDFEINQYNLLILTETTATVYGLQLPLRRSAPPLRRQNINSQFKIGEYDEICSDQLFYIVGPQSAYIINPNHLIASSLFSEVWIKDEILSVDAVNIKGKEIFFMRTKTQILAYVFTEEPTLTISWGAKTPDFNMSLTAFNPSSKSQPYNLLFNVLDFNQTIIQPTPAFNESEVRSLGKFKTPANNATYYAEISLNDSNWFEGTVLNYSIECVSENCSNYTSIRNHVQLTRDVVIEGRAIYDIQSTIDGIYAQQYSSLFKSYTHNDSIHFISKVPTTRIGEVCSKLATGGSEGYVVSLCQLGDKVNVYITSLVAQKPFTFGPYPTDAKSVNHAKIVGNILMIVDNEDNPFVRSGGVFLYHINYDIDDPDFISLLDYIDHDDLQIQGFSGTPYIGSADMHQPFYEADHQYRLFLTETRTGAIFVFGFEVSPDGQQLIYLSKNFIPLDKILPIELKYPTPLKVLTINIHYAFADDKIVEYYLLLSVQNWHHMEIKVLLNHNDDILEFKLERLFERFPWELQNYFKYKRGRLYETYFAVPYIDYDIQKQVILVYSVPFILDREANSYDDKYSEHNYDLYMGVPIIRAFGAHYVRDTYETAYAFHTFGNDKLLWSDMDGQDISEITLFKNISILIQGTPLLNDTVYISAVNPYSNYTFAIDLTFEKDKDDDKEKDYLWLGIIGIGVVMIIGLLIAYCKQRRSHDKHHHHHRHDLAETLITTNERESVNINRSSADPESARGSVEPDVTTAVSPALPPPESIAEQPLAREQAESDENASSSGDEVADLTH